MNGNQSKTASDSSMDVLLNAIQELVMELHPSWPKTRQVLPDSSLSRDLGLDSLARVELLTRIERVFNVTLEEKKFIEAETPGELWQIILKAGPSLKYVPASELKSPGMAETYDLPHGARTLVDALNWHVEHHPDRPHIRLYSDEGDGEIITYRELADGAQAAAAGLQEKGLLPGEAVSIMLPTSREYFFTFLGILLAGGIPVPIYPPFRMNQLEDHLRRHSAILNNCGAKIMVIIPEAKRFAQVLKAQVESMHTLVTFPELTSGKSAYTKFTPAMNDIAFLQYTSGSTGNPKGVVLTHANLLANIRALGEVVQVKSTDVIISWLPLYHDMGLIGTWLSSLYFAALLVVMSPLSFISRPQRWLWAIHRYRGTISAAPNFAYELCLKRLTEQDLQGLDLSSWRIACNGAEPVSPETVENFCREFARYGFQRTTFMPVYGLAECSVGLAFPPLDRGPLVDRIDRDVFVNTGRAVPSTASDENVLRFVACGHPLPGHEVRIVDAAGLELPERCEGKLHFRGPSATSGYYHNEEETKKLFDGDWLDSGDMAYIAGGDIFITGRKKDIIIRAGRNIYPQELEEAVGKIAGIRKGNVVVFASQDKVNQTEKLVVMAETREENPGKLNALRQEINTLAMDLVGTAADEVVLAPPGTVLKTSSGKIRRAGNRSLFESGRIGKDYKATWWQITRITASGILPEMRRLWHGTQSVLYAAYCLLLFFILAPVTWLTVVLLPKESWRWAFMRKVARFLGKASCTLIDVQGTENLPRESSCIFVANHASYLDNFLMVAVLPMEVSFVAKAELKESFPARVFLQRIQAEFVERFDRKKSLEDARRVSSRASKGRSLFFFAEGGFTRVPGLRPFHMGAFETAVEADVPVVPIAIRGTRSMLRDVSLFPRRGTITVTIGKPIEPRHAQDLSSPDAWTTALKLRDATRAHILKHCGEPDLTGY
ncbi:MAG TPA: AMP-binding protein [Smithella sp.]|nr:AMP-binding protein [Smithella sp.]HNY50164.1 AMP-binding protein [Smithella sp.]HOG89519.1 AMP-binding protein [Smithella sp.]HOU49855.1 AMP-binding protein [Smithella sp.]HQG64584.1 AMP-binding protein [Smithella sp.]